MIVDPVVTPEINPVESPAVATPGVLLLHVPPVEGSVKVTGEPAQIMGVLTIGEGVWSTVITVKAKA